MKKNIKILVFLSLIVILSACTLKKNEVNDPAVKSDAEKKENIIKVEKEYKSALVEILKPYWESQQIAGIKDKILELRAPAEDFNLHFNLVVAFELLEQGQAESDQSKIEEGMEKIKKLQEEYSWIK